MALLGRALKSARPRVPATAAREGVIQQVATVATYSQLGQQVVGLPGQLAATESRKAHPTPGDTPPPPHPGSRSTSPGLVAIACWTLIGSAVFMVVGSLAEGNVGGVAAGATLIAVGAVAEILRRIVGTRSSPVGGPATPPNRTTAARTSRPRA